MVCLFFQSHLYYHPTVKSPIGFSSSLASLMNQLAGIFLTPDKLVFTFYSLQANGPQLKGSLLIFVLVLIDIVSIFPSLAGILARPIPPYSSTTPYTSYLFIQIKIYQKCCFVQNMAIEPKMLLSTQHFCNATNIVVSSTKEIYLSDQKVSIILTFKDVESS